MMTRREAEQRGKPKPKPLGKPDPSKRPPQASETLRELDATLEWLAYVRAGLIEVR